MRLNYLRKKDEINEGIYHFTEIFSEEYPYYTTWISKKQKEFDTFEKEVIAIENNDKIVGYSMVHNCSEKHSKINGIYIFEEFEGNGYASQFLNKLVEESKEKGRKYLLIQARLNNNAVVKLFNKTNFIILGTNYHSIEEKDNWVAINDLQGISNGEEMANLVTYEYPGFQSLQKEEIDTIISENKNKSLVLRRKK